jgi:hypothetical protein
MITVSNLPYVIAAIIHIQHGKPNLHVCIDTLFLKTLVIRDCLSPDIKNVSSANHPGHALLLHGFSSLIMC